MGMNIRNEETERLVRELAALTGESETAAVTTAVRERLERLRPPGGADGMRLQRMKQIAAEAAALIREPHKSIDHGDLLYDEKGLPK